MRGPRLLLEPVGAVGKLPGFDHQQVGTGIYADVLQLCRLLAQRPDLAHVVLEPPASRCIAFFQGPKRARIGLREIRALLRAQEQRAVGDVVEKGAVVARRDHGAVARQAARTQQAEALDR